MSKIVEANEKIAEKVVAGYKKIEAGVVGGYKKIETGVVEGFGKVSDKCVETLFAKEGETVEDAIFRNCAKTPVISVWGPPYGWQKRLQTLPWPPERPPLKRQRK